MEALLNTDAISSHHDVQGLKRLYDSVEAHIRGLQALGLSARAYGGMLSSVLVNNFPTEPRLIILREMVGDSCDLIKVMKIMDWVVDARERASVLTTSNSLHHWTPTAATIVASNKGLTGNCVYCGQDYTSNTCTTITNVAAWREILCKAGRYYTCLKKYYLSKDCHSRLRCESCHGRHHITISIWHHLTSHQLYCFSTCTIYPESSDLSWV